MRANKPYKSTLSPRPETNYKGQGIRVPKISCSPDSMKGKSAKNHQKDNGVIESVSALSMRLPLTGSHHFQMSQHSGRNIV